VVLCAVVCDAVVGLGGGVVAVWVTVAVVTPALLVALLEVEVEVEVDVRVALALSAGTGAPDCGRVTVACAPVTESLDASDPDRAGADVVFTALPIPKPAAIASTTSTPSSHQRRFMSRHPFARFSP
jgi:hypothetical protein